jgi:hypothetical protein
MPEHLNQDQLQGYRDRTLALGELVAVDAHLGGCEPCRTALAGLADGSASSVLSAIEQARFRHLSYEHMDDWVEDRLAAEDRELVMAHIGLCAACARQLIAYQEYAPAMAAPVGTAAMVEEKQSFWAFLKQPQYALGAAALIAFFIILPLRHSAREETGAILTPTSTTVDSTVPAKEGPLFDEALNATELDSLPDSLRVGAKEAISDSGSRPAALKGLQTGPDAVLEYPFAEVVQEAQPEMLWKAFGDSSYTVSLSDARGLISRRAGLTETRWSPPSALSRDRVYTWEVESAGVKHRGMFRVLSENREKELSETRAAHGGSHFVMGAVDEELGLLTAAKREFEAMAKDRATAAEAKKLLERVELLRK